MNQASYNDFANLDIRVGTVLTAEPFLKATKPAYILTIDFGEKIGVLKSSAQLTDLYNVAELVNKQVVAVVNFPAKQIANVLSQCLVLGLMGENGVVLIQPDRKSPNGLRLA